MNNMGRATIKKNKGVTEKKAKILMNLDVLAIFRVELQQRKLFCKKKNNNKDAEMTEETVF